MRISWEKFSDWMTQFAGGKAFFIGFTVASILWTMAGVLGLDREFGAFTLALSILAIYLVMFLQNSQNREQAQFKEWLVEDNKNTKEILDLLQTVYKDTHSE